MPVQAGTGTPGTLGPRQRAAFLEILVNAKLTKYAKSLLINSLPVCPYADTPFRPPFHPRFSPPKAYLEGSAKDRLMFHDPLFLIATVVCLAVLIILMIG